MTKSRFSQLPPPRLRYKVINRPEASVFLETGKQISEDIEGILKKASFEIKSFKNVLDFGCGCGRTLRWFENRGPDFYGTDIDNEAIDWCREHLKFAKFSVNGPVPPLDYKNEMFDFIYAMSVFTHINEEFQLKWIDELHRILRKDGILMATFHGAGTWSWLLPEELDELRRKGFIYRITNDKKGLLPRWYQTSHHTKEYILNTFGEKFKPLVYSELGLVNHNLQDAVLFQKARSSNSVKDK